MTTPQDILTYWYADINDDGHVVQDRAWLWWQKQPKVDAEIQDKFAELVPLAAAGGLDDWRTTADGTAALILILDQFTRNMFRNTPYMFAYDAKARELIQAGLAQGQDQALPFVQRVFFYLPLEHAEDGALQQQSVDLFTALYNDVAASLKETYLGYLDYANQHKEIIDRFGRFPHRNEILRRSPTPEEIEFLKQPNSSF